MMDKHWISRSFSDKIKYGNTSLNIGLSTLASSYKGTEDICKVSANMCCTILENLNTKNMLLEIMKYIYKFANYRMLK